MVTKTALWNPKEQLLDHECTEKWILPQSGRIPPLAMTVTHPVLELVGVVCCARGFLPLSEALLETEA
jgi:hypothetical protein